MCSLLHSQETADKKTILRSNLAGSRIESYNIVPMLIVSAAFWEQNFLFPKSAQLNQLELTVSGGIKNSQIKVTS